MQKTFKIYLHGAGCADIYMDGCNLFSVLVLGTKVKNRRVCGAILRKVLGDDWGRRMQREIHRRLRADELSAFEMTLTR